LKQKNDELLSNFAFKFNLRRYTAAGGLDFIHKEAARREFEESLWAGPGGSCSPGAYTRPLFGST